MRGSVARLGDAGLGALAYFFYVARLLPIRAELHGRSVKSLCAELVDAGTFLPRFSAAYETHDRDFIFRGEAGVKCGYTQGYLKEKRALLAGQELRFPPKTDPRRDLNPRPPRPSARHSVLS